MGADEQQVSTTNLADYRQYPFVLHEVELDFDIDDEYCTVISRLRFEGKEPGAAVPLVLDAGADVEFVAAYVNSLPLKTSEYELTPTKFTVHKPPTGGPFTFGAVVRIKPQNNTALEGLYKSGDTFCSQCEAEGFRHITYFPDRPDVMGRSYSTRITADKAKYPVLLSNGNPVASGDLTGGRHFAMWVDPWPKPSYLFCIVAANLTALEDKFITCSGREVTLRIWTEAHNADKTSFAMTSLKNSMKWDEERFGLEYDLDLFNIVAVDAFNMGAMENKSLNVFNSSLILASPETATDGDYAAIEGVIGHEYFHNYTGDRVTCRDWFQLSLKEGLTVFRDQEFSSDLNSRPVKRIEDVRLLRARQFPEDAGPMAHPVRPQSYQEISNFYTMTVYEKGAEVIRMYATLLGREGFRKGMDLYFKRHDGQAVTTDDFFAAMADANPGVDISALKAWYSQAGTPTLTVETSYDKAKQSFTVKASQSLPKTPDKGGDQPKKPQLIPICVGLLGASGKDIPLGGLAVDGGAARPLGGAPEAVLPLAAASATFTLSGVAEEPVVASILRDFSAPVHLKVVPEPTEQQLTFLLQNDSDAFNRFEAAQTLGSRLVLRTHQKALAAGAAPDPRADVAWPALVSALRAVLVSGTKKELDRVFVAEALSLPTVSELLSQSGPTDPVALHRAREAAMVALARDLEKELREAWEATAKEEAALGGYRFEHSGVQLRALRNTALAFLARLGPEGIALAEKAFDSATNMTDSMAALKAASCQDGPHRARVLAHFYEKWKHNSLVVNKWLSVQAVSNLPGAIARMDSLIAHEAMDTKNPNRCYSVFLGFGRHSFEGFHAEDGSGYRWLADAIIKVDKLNPIVAARMADPFTQWAAYDGKRQGLMKAELRRILDSGKLSPNTFEIVSKSLK